MRRSRVDLRVREEEKQDWLEAAEKLGIGLSELVRREMKPHTSRSTKALLKSKQAA